MPSRRPARIVRIWRWVKTPLASGAAAAARASRRSAAVVRVDWLIRSLSCCRGRCRRGAGVGDAERSRGHVVQEPAEQGGQGGEVGGVPAGGHLREVVLAVAAEGVEGGVPGVGDVQPAGPAVGLVGHALDQAALHEGGDVPADGRGVGVHQFGERALAQRAEPDQREEQHERRPVAAVVLRGLGLERVHQPHEPRHLLREGAHRGRPVDRDGSTSPARATGRDMGLRTGKGTHARYNPLHGARNQLHRTPIVIRRTFAARRTLPDPQCDPGPVVRQFSRGIRAPP